MVLSYKRHLYTIKESNKLDDYVVEMQYILDFYHNTLFNE